MGKDRPSGFIAAIVAAVLPLAGCTSAPAKENVGGDDLTIFITSNGWHTGIIIARADIPEGTLPETADSPDARFFEFGWGDAEFYPAKKTTFAMTMQAALVPTPAVMHMVGLWTSPRRYFPKAEVVTLAISPDQLGRLLSFIDGSFERAGAERVTSSGPGLYADSRFYPAKGSFHLLNTCNTWTAKALLAAGYEIKPVGITQAEALMQQVRTLAGR